MKRSVMGEATVSVITGFYNRAHLAERTLDSLLAQTYEPLEIIVFDDCSQDDTRAVLDRYRALGDPRLLIIEHEANMGFTRGMINAIGISSGKFIAVQGSGDVSLPDRIEKQVRAMEEHPDVCAVGCFYENVVEQTGIVRMRTTVADDTTMESLLHRSVFSHGEVMMRRDAYIQAGGYRPEFRYSLDFDLWLRMIQVGRFFTVKEVLYKRYVQFDGVSYDPVKFLTQARYRIVASQLAQASDQDRERLLLTLGEEGPEALVPVGHPELQERLSKASARAAVWGDSSSAVALAGYVRSLWVSSLLKLFGKMFNSRLFTPARRIMYRALGISPL